MPTSSLKTKLRAWAATQWERIPPVPHAHAGSYDRGYQNGLADVLRGVQKVLESSGDETTGWCPRCDCDYCGAMQGKAERSAVEPSEPLGHSCRDGWRIGEMKDCALCAPENGSAR